MNKTQARPENYFATLQNRRLKSFLKKQLRNGQPKKGWHYRITQLACILLMASFLVNSTPGAPRYVGATSVELGQDIRFSFLSGNWRNYFPNMTPALFLFSLTKSKSTVSRPDRIEILPGNITVHQGEQINLSAIGYDSKNEPISGLKFKWTLRETDRKGVKLGSLSTGTFRADHPGKYLIVAEAGGMEAEVTITVAENKALLMLRQIQTDESAGRTANSNRIKEAGQYSTEQISSKNSYRSASTKSNDGGSSTQRPPDEQGWGGGNWWTADDPGNQTGNPPGTSPQASAGNGNFQITAPVTALNGRGIDVNLSLTYNSRSWSKSGNVMSYDSDRGFPAPGWSFGFGKMMNMGNSGGCMLVDGDGTRRSYTGSIYSYTYGSYSSMSFTGHTSDGTFMDYNCYYSSSPYGKSLGGSVKLSNGTTIYYNSSTANGQQAFPTFIQDAQGNYINITYRNNNGPEVNTVTDTMGRVTTFNYDSLNRLISVSVPKLDNAGTRTAVRIHYKQITVNPGFAYPLTTDASNWYPYVIDAIYYPGTGTGYWFNDSDSYSSYGMIAKVLQKRGMSWSAGPDEQGTITAGQTSKQDLYNYPMTPNYALTDSPTFTTMTETWEGMDTAAAVTSYDIQMNANPRLLTITQPNGAKNKQLSYNNPGVWNDGLIYQDQTLDASNNQLSKSVVTWQQGSYDTARPSRVDITDEANQTTATDFIYGTSYNQLTSKKEYGYDGNLVRESRSEYENNANYIALHIFNLTKVAEVYDGLGNRVARTEYQYDDNAVVNGTGTHNLKAATGVIMHDNTYDPFTTETYEVCSSWYYNYPECNDETTWAYVGEWPYLQVYCPDERVCTQYSQFSIYNSFTQFRGNLTKKTAFADAVTPSGGIVQNLQYDIAGNLVKTSSAANEATYYNYDISTQFAYPTSQSIGASDLNSSDRNTSSMVYDFNTGVVKQSTDTNGRTSSTTYNPENLRPTQSTASTGAYFKTFYDDAALTTTEEHYESNGTLAGKGIKYLNGMGKIKREDSLGAGSVWDIVETKYTVLEEVWKRSRPYRSGDTVQWTENIFDIQGRVTQVTEPDGSVVQAFYNESSRPSSASNLPGQTVRFVDAWGRERWERYDSSGTLAEVVEPNPDGNGSVFSAGNVVTKYKMDVLGQLVETEQGDQHRYFQYNSLGQMTRQKLAEQKATINDAGQYVGVGNPAAKWGNAFWYDSEANLTMKIDARGVKTHYNYQVSGQNDPLNRMQYKYDDLSGPLDPGITIHQTPFFSFEYMTTGDRVRIKKVRTSGILTEDYAYDVEGRISDYTQTVDYRTSYPMKVSYVYDSLDRVVERRDPAQYGLSGSPRRLSQNTYDVASRLSNRTSNGQQQIGNIVYDAANRATSLKIGVAGTNQVTENYTYSAQTGLLTNQNVVRNSQTLLDLTYDYQRNNSLGTLNGKTGQVTKIIDNLDSSRNREYIYDTVSRLTQAKGGANIWQQTYVYDRYGNRTNVGSSGVAANGSAIPQDGLAHMNYNSADNRITNTGFEYDSAGNQTRAKAEDGTWLRYEYDSSNRLQIIKKDDGTPLQAYQYGATAYRLMDYDYVANKLIIFASENGATISEYTEFTATVPTWTKGHTYLGSNVLSTSSPNGQGGEITDFNHYDQLSTRMVTNQASGGSFKQVHLPFGTALNGESTGSINKRFTNYERSSRTGLDYAVNRTYDSKLGRFTQVDPIGMSAVDYRSPQTLNLYSYCANDPINHTDPDGLFFGFLKKFFKWLSKVFKYIAMAVAIVVAVVTIVLMPATAALWFKIFTIIGAVASAASSVFQVLGLKTLATIFGIIGAVAGLGSSLLNKTGDFVWKFWTKGWKTILGVIKAGANLAAQILSAAGHTLASNILGIVSTVAGAINDLLKAKTDNGQPLLDTKGNPKLRWTDDGWAWYKAIRTVAQKVAATAGAKHLAQILDLAGLPEDVRSIVRGIKFMRLKQPKTDEAIAKAYNDGKYIWKGYELKDSDSTDDIIRWELGWKRVLDGISGISNRKFAQ